MKLLKTFGGDENLKSELVSQLEHHQKLDAFVQGSWLTKQKVEGNGFRGCFYGCTMQTEESPLVKFSEKYQIDLWFVYLTEKIFENLPDGEYQKFPLESIKNLPVGIDFDAIRSKFHYRLLMDGKMGQITFCKDNKECQDAIKQCANLFESNFSEISESAAESAESAARSAWSAAWSARSAAESARSATWSARSAAWSARSAAWSAESARSAARSAARADYYIWLRDLLFETIREHKN